MSHEVLHFRAPIELTAAGGDGKTGRCEILAYTGGLFSPPGWPNSTVDLAGAELPASIPLLAGHSDNLDSIVGQGQPEVRAGHLVVHGQITDATAAGMQVLALARSGIGLQASIGFSPGRRERVEGGATVNVNGRILTAPAGGMTILRSGRLREVSLLPIGADPNTEVQIAARVAPHEGTRRMADEVNTSKDTAPTPSALERIQARWDRETWHAPDAAPRHRAEKALMAAMAHEITFEDFERELLEARVADAELHAIRSARPAGVAAGPAAQGDDAPILEASLLCHLGAEDVSNRAFGDQVTQRARDAKLTSLVEILQAAWRNIGQEPPRERDELIRASFSTAAIGNIVSNVQNKILLDQWQRLGPSCLQLCRQVSAKDFKESKAVRLVGRDAMLEKLGPTGIIKHGHLQDFSATFQLDTYARLYAVTRQDIVNDDLGALNELPRVIARGAGLKLESVFWALVLANAGSFFGDGNGNATTAVLGLAGLATATALMRKLTDADGEPILTEPRRLVVPPELETTADSLFASTNIVMAGTSGTITTQANMNPFSGKYRPLVVPYISNANYSGNSTTKWYLFGDPSSGISPFLVAFLNAATAPTIEQSQSDFATLGMQYRGFLDFGFAQCDPQGAVMSTGAGA